MSYVAGDLLMGGTPDYAGMAAKSEKARQGIINLGNQEINAVFSGGSAPFYHQVQPGAKPDPTQSYYNFGTGQGFSPYYTPATGGHGLAPFSMANQPNNQYAQVNKDAQLGAAAGSVVPGLGTAIGGLIGGGIGAAQSGDVLGFMSMGMTDYLKEAFKRGNNPQQSLAERINKGNIYTQTNPTFQGFTPDFYNQRAQAYVNYAMPQLAQQYRDTRNTIGYGLANRGLRGSGTAQTQYSDLARTNTEAQQQIADTGRSQAQALQQQVEDEKNTLINQLYQSADPARGVQQAISAAAGFQAPSTFAPLANSFSGLINQYYANQVLNPKQGIGYAPPLGYGTGLNTGALPGNYSVGS